MIYLLHHALDDSAQRYPDHDAMRFQDAALTYGALADRADRLAALLIDQGVRKGDRIGVMLDKSLETVISIYAIMKAGAAYVPLDPRSPTTRVADIIADCGLKAILTQENKIGGVVEAASAADGLQFVVGAHTALPHLRAFSWEDAASFPTGSGRPSARPRLMEGDLAYIMYTSGSTGKPKGIMHTHASGLSYARLSAALYDVNHADRVSNHSPLHFDMSTFDYLTAVLCGATTTIIPETYTLFPANLSTLIERERLTIWYSVPFALIQLLLRGVLEERDLSSLRWVLYGGEPFALPHLRALMEALPNARFSNVYGPAEVNQCTYYHIPPPTEWTADMETIPLGEVWDNADGLIIGDDDAPVVPGEAGELVIRAPTMMRGYWNRPDLNARAFYRRLIFPDFEAVFYRTGDLVRQRADGLIEFIGRKDHQVKIRGFRVELSEVETALAAHPAVEQGAAFVLRREDGDELAAAVIRKVGAGAQPAEIIGFLRGRLPVYAVPSKLVLLEQFPRTGTGKVDRNRLMHMIEKGEPA